MDNGKRTIKLTSNIKSPFSYNEEGDFMIGYIKKEEECRFFNKIFNTIKKEDFENGIKYSSVRFNSKLLKTLLKDNIKIVAIAKKDKTEEEFINTLYANNIDVLNGKFLFKNLLPEIVEYLYNKVETNKEKLEFTILINDFTKVNLFYIYDILKRAKGINIVTNNISKFKKWSNELYDNEGIVVPVMNNKMKSLKNKRYIINIDFTEEQLNKYKINRRAILINIEENININSKSFEGINVNNFIIKKVDELNEFNYNEVYESFIINKSINEIRRKIENDKVKIMYLQGKNGIINENEYK